MNEIYKKFIDVIHPIPVHCDEPMSKHTTFRIGGPTDLYVEATTTETLVNAVKKARELHIPFHVLGGGSNVLVKDKGVRGLVIQVKSDQIDYFPEEEVTSPPFRSVKIQSRFNIKAAREHISAEAIDYDESDYPRGVVIADAGVGFPAFIRKCFENHFTGLQWFAGIPGSVGGALYNNIHTGVHHLSDVLLGAEVLDENFEISFFKLEEMNFGYDESIFRTSRDLVILRVHFGLFKGDLQRARKVHDEWLGKKNIYEGYSAGCVFSNLSPKQEETGNLPTSSIGFINDKILGIVGLKEGGALLGKFHGNFITNEGNATASDVLKMIDHIKKLYYEKFGVQLQREINVIGE